MFATLGSQPDASESGCFIILFSLQADEVNLFGRLFRRPSDIHEARTDLHLPLATIIIIIIVVVVVVDVVHAISPARDKGNSPMLNY